MAGDLYDINVIFNPAAPEEILVTVRAPGDGIPNGGTSGQTIQKTSDVDGESTWTDMVLVGDPASPPAGLGIGQLLWDNTETRPTGKSLFAKTPLVSVAGTAATWTKIPFTTYLINKTGFTIASNAMVVPEDGVYVYHLRVVCNSAIVVSDGGYGNADYWFTDTNATTIPRFHTQKVYEMAAGSAQEIWVYNRGATSPIYVEATIYRIN